MNHYRNTATGEITTRLPNNIGPHKGLTYPRDWSTAVAAGWRKLLPFDLPDGYTILSHTYVDETPDTQREYCVTIQTEEYQQARLEQINHQVGERIQEIADFAEMIDCPILPAGRDMDEIITAASAAAQAARANGQTEKAFDILLAGITVDKIYLALSREFGASTDAVIYGVLKLREGQSE